MSDDLQSLKQRIRVLEAQVERMGLVQAMMGPLLEAIPAVVMRIGLDARLEFINRVLPEYVGVPLIGASIYEFAPFSYHEVMRAAFELAIRERRATSFESEAMAPDGTRDWYASTFAPILDGQELVGLVLIATNVTRTRRNEADLKDREARLTLALEAGNVGIWRWDALSDVVQWDENLCSMFGVLKEAAPQTEAEFMRLISPDQAGRMAAHIKRALESGNYPDFELRVDSPEGTRWMMIKGGAITDDNDRVTALLGGVIDITERRRFERRVTEAQKLEAVGQLAAGVAHNFNNVLTSIVLTLERGRLHGSQEDRALMADALESAFHAAGLVRDLLAFSRGRSAAPVRHEPLVAAVRRAIVLGKRTFDRRITLELTGLDAPSLTRVAIDGSAVEQLLMNLLLNARDAVDGLEAERCHIDVSLRRVAASELPQAPPDATEDFVELRVEDRGVGMNEATRLRCFEPFFTTKEVGKGTGLGLSTAWAAVTALGGFVECESRPGVGTTFSVYLPASAPAESRAAPLADAPEAKGSRHTVLVVDDEPAVRRVCIAVLEQHGFVVIGAASGEEAVQVAVTHAVDAVLLDYSMPGMSAEETLRRLRQLRPALPIVSHSGLSVLLEGASSHLAKPATAEGIVDAIRRALDADRP